MVVLTLKNLQQQSFSIEIDLLCSVKELKEKIEKENGADYPAGGQKLIYAGKILQDDSNLESYNIDTKKFLVIMVTKPKGPPPSSEPSDPTVIPTSEASITDQPEAAASDSQACVASSASSDSITTPSTVDTNTSASVTPTNTSTGTSSSRAVDNAESVIVMGEEFNKMVENIVEMGYERSKVEQALRASFNNPYTAVQYLVDGIPQNLELGPGGDGNDAPSGDVALREGPDGEEDEDPLAFLRNQPQFTEMRQMIRSNPQLLDAFIQQIGGTNPELLQVIQQNQDAFVRMLNEGQESATTAGRVGSALSGNPAPSSGSNPASGQSARGGQQIMVSPQDKEAIERLKALGNFPEDVVIQAYFACEKNENLAAEFLFSQSWD